MDFLRYIVTTIVPIILTGVVTGFVSNIQQRNTDKSKKEIAYDKVYYPIYIYMRGRTFNIETNDEIIAYVGDILRQNDKYISNTTKIYFEHYLICVRNDDIVKVKKAYLKLQEHISDYNWKLRNNLCYVNSSFLEVFDSFSGIKKASFIAYIIIFIEYILSILYMFLKKEWVLLAIAFVAIGFFLVIIYCIYYLIEQCIIKRINKIGKMND